MLLSCHNIHVEILHLFQQDVSSHMQHRPGIRVLFCFHPVFVGTFTCLKFGTFPTC